MNRVADPRETGAIIRDPPDKPGTPIERPQPAKKKGRRAQASRKRKAAGDAACPLPGEDES